VVEKQMNEMVERVARALHDESARKYNSPDGPAIYAPWDTLTGHNRKQFYDYAKVAIAAMREPTEQMVAALESLFASSRRHKNFNLSFNGWLAMIDEVLNDKS
jgi:hypothetical protein